jgi:hypothetical protein
MHGEIDPVRWTRPAFATGRPYGRNVERVAVDMGLPSLN